VKKLSQQPAYNGITATDIGNIFAAELDNRYYVEKNMGIVVYENQIAAVNAIANRALAKVCLLMTRQTGKTDSLAQGSLILGDRYTKKEHGNILIFGPREGQAALVLNRIHERARYRPYFDDIVDWKSSTKGTIVFKDKGTKWSREPGIQISQASASEMANIEGFSAGLIMIDESQKVSDKVVSEVILPMGGAWGARIIKSGTPRLRNHFHHSFKDPTYTKCIFPWEMCGILNRSGTIDVDGTQTSRYVLDRMPIAIKQETYPHNPIVIVDGRTMRIHDLPGDMIPDDFRTQYMLEWLVDADLFFSEEQVEGMLGGGPIIHGSTSWDGGEYYASWDPAGGSSTDSDGTGKNDWSALSIVRKVEDLKTKVHSDERYGTDYTVQLEWVRSLISKDGRFPCKALIIDMTGCGQPVLDFARQSLKGIGVYGIMYSRTDPESGKNWKNAIFDHILMEVDRGLFKYPDRSAIDGYDGGSGHKPFQNSVRQWENLEKHTMLNSPNKKICAPNGEHDDHPCADAMVCYIADKLMHIKRVIRGGGGQRARTPAMGRGLSGGGGGAPMNRSRYR